MKDMKINGKLILLFALIIATLACNAVTPKPTQTPVPTAEILPTSTLEPTSSPVPTEKPTNVEIEATSTEAGGIDLPVPAGTPTKEWKGIPIMPGAIAGADEGNTYSFTIKASTDEIQSFYENELKKLGWNSFAVGQGQTETVLLMFMKGSETLTLTFLSQSDGTIYVMLVK